MSPARSGLPVWTIFSAGNQRSSPGKPAHTQSTCRASSRLVMPGNPFCSWMTVGMPALAAAQRSGPLANPPTPTATSGLNRRTIRRLIHSERRSLNGNNRFRAESLRSMPVMGNPVMVCPAAGTRSISMRPPAPTNSMTTLGLRAVSASAMASAGWMWPPVPPPEIRTRSGRSGMGVSGGRLGVEGAGWRGPGVSMGSAASGSVRERLTDRIMPRAMQVTTMEVPPMETRGRGWPVMGSSWTATPMLTMAWKVSMRPSPMASRLPKGRGHRVPMRMARENKMR